MLYELHFHLHEVAPYINWLYFFHAWGFPAKLGSIAKVHGCEACRQNWLQRFSADERPRAREAIRLFDEATRLLNELDSQFMTHARIALLPAFSDGDDIVVRLDESSNAAVLGSTKDSNAVVLVSTKDSNAAVLDSAASARVPLLRQQQPGNDGICWCLSDFISPHHSVNQENEPIANTIGIFVCSADEAIEQRHTEDEYLRLLHQTLADRLAEATAEHAHEIVRKKLWGYAPNEQLTIEELWNESYQGKRPAVGYPSLPDQSLNFVLDSIIDFGKIGVTLTENGAMRPHASTSGLMLAHPATRHFSIGNVGPDQLADYAKRRGMNTAEISRFFT